MSISRTKSWIALTRHARQVGKLHLRDLLRDRSRCRALTAKHDGILLDTSRQLATPKTLELLLDLAREADLHGRIRAMGRGELINVSENRAVLHMALRATERDRFLLDGENVVDEVLAVRASIRRFASRVRSGRHLGATGERLTDVVAIGIGGSYLGPEFVAESLRTDRACARASRGRTLRFLANVDPIDVTRALDGLDPARTLVVVISKTFTTAETILNAKTVRAWLVKALGKGAVARQMVAVSTNLEGVAEFGIDPNNTFGFWDWVGGRYSVSSAVGLLPLALHYGPAPIDRFLLGARSVDRNFMTAPLARNLPVLLGLFGIWNSSFLGHSCRALLPYCQALHRFPAHIQQVDMESNGKRVDVNGKLLRFEAGEIDFGEPGTNGQHSFYQLLHQGRVVPADFIGFKKSQQPVKLRGEAVSNHDELMSNFFAQPDALAVGRSADEWQKDGLERRLVPHKVFPGNRPSNVLLLPVLDPYTTGQLLSLYEHRTAVQGFIWGLNSFDQMGVELGKVLARKVRGQFAAARGKARTSVRGFNPSTSSLLKEYLR